jgi:tetratricopeptide (TPR) repeat protein
VVRRQPNAWYLIVLGDMKTAIGQRAESAEVFQRAAMLSRDHLNSEPNDYRSLEILGVALDKLGDRAGAVAALQQAVLLRPDAAAAHGNLGNALLHAGDWARAIAAFRKAIHLEPDSSGFHGSLGIALLRGGNRTDAIAELREAVRLKPDDPGAHGNLGLALRDSGNLAGAIAEQREAIRLKPDFAEAHYDLGLALDDSGDQAGAIAALREAILLKLDFAMAHENLGILLHTMGDRDGAVAEFREVVRLSPGNSVAHGNLGAALRDLGKRTEAIVEFREAVRLQPDNPANHCNLGLTLRDLGRFQEALVELQCGHKLGVQLPRWQHPSATWVKECQREVELERKLSGILSGKDRPADAAERTEFASVAGRKGFRAAAARLFADAFVARPALADDLMSGHRYNAACYAAYAGCGKGRDEPPPGPADRARLRAQALGWLKADLAAWAQRLDGSPTQARAAMVQQLRDWRINPDLGGVHNAGELAELPESERHQWQALWAEVDALLSWAEGRAARPADPPLRELPADPFAR